MTARASVIRDVTTRFRTPPLREHRPGDGPRTPIPPVHHPALLLHERDFHRRMWIAMWWMSIAGVPAPGVEVRGRVPPVREHVSRPRNQSASRRGRAATPRTRAASVREHAPGRRDDGPGRRGDGSGRRDDAPGTRDDDPGTRDDDPGPRDDARGPRPAPDALRERAATTRESRHVERVPALSTWVVAAGPRASAPGRRTRNASAWRAPRSMLGRPSGSASDATNRP